MKFALFYGHFSSNIGDLAINRGFIDLLSHVCGHSVSLKVFFLNGDGDRCSGKDSFKGYSGCEFYSINTSASAALRYANNCELFVEDFGFGDCDLVFINGGEHFFSYAENANWHNLFWRAIPALAAQAAGLAYAFLPASFGPFESQKAEEFVRQALGGARGFAYREKTSGEIFPLVDSPTLLDMAFFINGPYLAKPKKEQVHHLGVAVRPDGQGLRVGTHRSLERRDFQRQSNYNNSLSSRSAISAVKLFLERSDLNQVTLFVQCNADEELAEHIREELNQAGYDRRVTLARPSSIDEYISQLAAIDCLITSRFHAVILSSLACTPAVGLYYAEHGHKLPGLYEMLGRSDICRMVDESNVYDSEGVIGMVDLSFATWEQTFRSICLVKDETRKWFGEITSASSASARQFIDLDTRIDIQEVVSHSEAVAIKRALGEYRRLDASKKKRIVKGTDGKNVSFKKWLRRMVIRWAK
ncbi:polysaccharide pyruvyl transferase family protein [Pseudomonas songnenensis]|nr:polysaccharide pyruvyl transferase family protein [Pseudomonas songnenensis]MCQ4299673.1 polysaccharide pyruvyl transferase family protein [Pseudomonas songnenensis]